MEIDKRSFFNLDHDLDVILGTFATDTTSQLDVLGHDGDTLGVDCAQVGILEQTNEVGLGCFLKSYGTRTVTMRLLDTTGGRSGLPGSLGGQLLTRGLASGGFTSSLLGSCHDYNPM